MTQATSIQTSVIYTCGKRGGEGERDKSECFKREGVCVGYDRVCTRACGIRASERDCVCQLRFNKMEQKFGRVRHCVCVCVREFEQFLDNVVLKPFG
jgi:hypothetical protein